MRAPILQLVAGTALAGHVTARPSVRPEPEISATHANKLARDQRRDAWDIAEVVTRYWRARIDMHSAAACAQRDGLPEGQITRRSTRPAGMRLLTAGARRRRPSY